MMNKIKQAVQTRHKKNYRNAFGLRNVENGETMVYYTNTNSPWLDRLSKTQEWLTKQEELRLQGEKINSPNTKWVFEKHLFIDVKVILDRENLCKSDLDDCLIGSKKKVKSFLWTLLMTIFVSSGAWLFIEVQINSLIPGEPEN